MALILNFKKWMRELPIQGKFGRDVSWNISSLVVIGVSGILLSVLIGKVYGAATLGVFHQVYALYTLFSQLAVCGIHLSVLKHVSQFAGDNDACRLIIFSGLVLVAVIALGVCALLLNVHRAIGHVLQSPGVAVGLIYALPGLWCFAINKVLLAALNGHRRMRAYAVAHALRFILLIVCLMLCIDTDVPGIYLPVIFSGAEAILLAGLVVYVGKLYWSFHVEGWKAWIDKHFKFGIKAFGSGALIEFNSRIDVLMLGFFTSDVSVGIYSLAAMLADGLLQITAAIRTNINPVLTSLFVNHQTEKLKGVIKKGIALYYPIMAGVGVVAILLFPLLIKIFLPDRGFMVSWPIFAILMTGIMISSGYLPFNMLLIQAGHPGFYTVMVGLSALCNIVLNALLIPVLGVHGAAMATGASFILSVFIFRAFVHKKLQMNI